ncbi:MAG: hypothetical protein Kow0074_26160 [Candidatus Zixiibacteriota bacterium]
MRILASEGPRQFTTERVAAAVGITGGTIFRHFASMDDILDAIVDRMEEILFAEFPSHAGDALATLRGFYEQRIRVVRQHPELSRLLMTRNLIPNSGSNKREQRIEGLKRKSQRFVQRCLRDASRAGQLEPDVVPEEAGQVVIGAIHAIAHGRRRSGSQRAESEMIQRVWTMLERALTGRETTRQQ